MGALLSIKLLGLKPGMERRVDLNPTNSRKERTNKISFVTSKKRTVTRKRNCSFTTTIGAETVDGISPVVEKCEKKTNPVFNSY